MATLPDLNTDSTGQIAYYNVFDNLPDMTTDEWDPEDLLNYNGVSNAEVYDNGIVADIELTSITSLNAIVELRAKSDGWVVLTQPAGTSGSVEAQGLANMWRQAGFADHDEDPTEYWAEKVYYEELLYYLLQETPNWSTLHSDDFARSDLGWYNYEFPGAEGVTFLAMKETNGGDTTNSFGITDGTTIGRSELYVRFNNNVAESTVYADGSTVYAGGEYEDTHLVEDPDSYYGSLSSGTSYDLRCQSTTDSNSNSFSYCAGVMIGVWGSS